MSLQGKVVANLKSFLFSGSPCLRGQHKDGQELTTEAQRTRRTTETGTVPTKILVLMNALTGRYR